MKKMLIQVVFVLGLSPLAFAQRVSGPADDQVLTNRRLQMSEDEKISYLINFVRNLDGAIFIRNGDEYPPGKAADHLQSKWDKHKSKVKNARGFIDLLATYSATKEPYQIRFKDGNTIKCGDLLSQELKRIEI